MAREFRTGFTYCRFGLPGHLSVRGIYLLATRRPTNWVSRALCEDKSQERNPREETILVEVFRVVLFS